MAERMLITKLVRTEQARAELYAKGHQWPDLKLFDLSDLLDVGIAPNDLEIGQEVPCRFWAIYELSAKLNRAGNPYKDVIALEPMDGPATSTSTDTSALLDELRAIRVLLESIVLTQTMQTPSGAGASHVAEGSVSDLAQGALLRYGDGTEASDNPREREAYADYLKVEGAEPKNVASLRQWVLDTQDDNH
jgi:hypothetical protein